MQSDVKLQLQKAREEHAVNDISMRETVTGLTKEKDKLLCLSMERGKAIQVNKKKKSIVLSSSHTVACG